MYLVQIRAAYLGLEFNQILRFVRTIAEPPGPSPVPDLG